jgi:hypothetical protein
MTNLVPIPIRVFDQHIGLLGKTRSGKSSTARVLVEHLLDNAAPICIVDPKGDWWGIKLARDGKGPGYPVVVFGGEHADVPITEHAGAHVAELYATGNRPCLIDLGGWMPGARTRFWIDFASTMFRMSRGQRWLMVDEVHNFAPKGRTFDVSEGKALHWANRLASEGLGRGINLIVASQRPQKVHNDLLSSLETLLMKRVTLPADRDAIADWINNAADKKTGAEVLATLAELGREEAWCWSPEIGFGPERVKFPLFTTYDSFRPQTAEDAANLQGWAAVDLDDVKAKLATVVEEAVKNDPERLRKRIAELEDQVEHRPAAEPVNAAPDPEMLAELGRLREENQRLEHAYDMEQLRSKELHDKLMKVADVVADEARIMLGQALPPPPIAVAPPTTFPDHIDRHGAGTWRAPPRLEVTPRPAPPPRPPSREKSELPEGEHAIMVALVQYGSCTKEQLSILTSYKRSTRDAYIQRLRSKGYLDDGGSVVVPTSAGRKALPPSYKPLPTGRPLREHWLARLPDGERRILAAVIQSYPRAVPREQLELATGFKRSTRDAYIQRLTARKLVVPVGRGEIKAAAELF